MHVSNQVNVLSVKPAAKMTGLGKVAESRLRERLRRQSPSEPWVDAQFVEVSQVNERGELVVGWRHDPSVFPPGGSRTAMVKCAACGIFTPPQAMDGEICLDHRERGNWGPSPSAQAIARIRHYAVRLIETELLPESKAELQGEIQEFYKKAGDSRG